MIDTFQRYESKIDEGMRNQKGCYDGDDINTANQSLNQDSKLITMSDVEAFSICHISVCLKAST